MEEPTKPGGGGPYKMIRTDFAFVGKDLME